jgi:hypothetical protein
MINFYVIEFKNTYLGVYYLILTSNNRAVIMQNIDRALKFQNEKEAQMCLDNLIDKENYRIVEHQV